MPASHFYQCSTDIEHYVQTGEVIPAHRSACDLTNRHRDGFWRWFFAVWRCYCPCHTPGTPESYEVIIHERAQDTAPNTRDA